jgi:hypothetical protein
VGEGGGRCVEGLLRLHGTRQLKEHSDIR